ncbi:MAG: hypothetical protein HY532_00530 [Chloroflexi bacterium]|nr:hypothetical protein [Chloroflexota bacterium]
MSAKSIVARQRERAGHGSPPIAYRNSEIAAGVSWIENLEADPVAKKYAPMDYIEVVNNSNYVLGLYLDGRERLGIPQLSTKTVESIPFRSFRLVNEDGANAVAAGKVDITIQKIAEESGENLGKGLARLLPWLRG